MPLTLYAHPFSSYCQKVLIALYENDLAFTYRKLGEEDPEAFAELSALWPMKRFPVLRDGDATVCESSIIIEHLAIQHPGPQRFIAADPAEALRARMLDRFFDNYIMTPVQQIVGNSMRRQDERDPKGDADARALLDTAYHWLEENLPGQGWGGGSDFGIADCAAAPALFYADWTHAIGPEYGRLRAYRQRLLERPSFARAVEEARPYRPLFPLGAPDRD